MIPKIIHYIWIGKNPLPKEMQECLDSWKRYMPEYELKCWDDSTLGEFSNVFMNEALEEHKFAFASDVIRLYVIYKYGGIYMDTDVMVYKSFNPLLENHAFIGRENSMHQKVILLLNVAWIIMKVAISSRRVIGRYLHV